jgi:threonine/homoserine/homoserine lactone efflux protein
MPALSTFGLFFVSALALLIIPGPAVLYIVGRSIHLGRRAGLASVLGIAGGSLVHVGAAALGLSAVLLASSLAFSVVKYAGAAYLIYLGVRTLLGAAREQTDAPRTDRLHRIMAQGLVVNILNPKTALFFFAFIPQFVDPRRGPVAQQILWLGGLFVLLSLCTDATFALLAGTVGRGLQRHSGFRRNQRYVTGGIYVTLGLTAAFAGDGRK